jgi:hypothetical protein
MAGGVLRQPAPAPFALSAFVMPLQLPPGSRFRRASRDEALPFGAVGAFDDLIGRIAAQRARPKEILEHFKGAFCSVMGIPHWVSSDEGWAQTDLTRHMDNAAKAPELFLGAFFDACEELRRDESLELPPVSLMNEILREHSVPFEFDPPRLVRRGPTAQVAHPQPPPTLGDSASGIVTASFRRAEELLNERRPREAVQEMLWILESITTVFRGVELPTGTVQGRYFNEIARELRTSAHGMALERVIEWCTSLHGYLSSPTGGGVRHGVDLKAGTQISDEEGRLFCNLILSHVTFLMNEHARLHR